MFYNAREAGKWYQNKMDEVLQKISEGGPLVGWCLLTLSILAIVFLYKKVNDIQEARLSDMRQANDITNDVKDAILPLVSSLNAIQSSLEILKDRSHKQ